MSLLIISIVIILIVMLTSKKTQNNSKPNKVKNIFLEIILFIAFLIVYYFIISFIVGIPLAYLGRNIGDGSDNGLWAYGLIAGFMLSPICSLITTIKLTNKKNKDNNLS